MANVIATRAIHVGSAPDPSTGAVIAPISLSTTFAQSKIGEARYEYTRSGNPNRDAFEAAIASLENAEYALAFASGSATTACILQTLDHGSHLISASDVYGGTYRYMTKVAHANGISTTFADLSRAQVLRDLVQPSTRMVWIETPSNPTLSLIDIPALSAIAHELGLIVVVDNTFLSPYLCNPLSLGADIVTHSVTKYINGHSDVLMGVLATSSDTLFEKLKFLQNAIGAVPSAFDCFLAHRGLKTLHLRARASSESALAVATALEAHPNVLAVSYPGLKSHPQHELALRQHKRGYGGGMISFRVKGGAKAVERFLSSTRIFTLAESLGGIESLCEWPARMTHASIPLEHREKVGVFDDLIRLSVGCEDTEDLVEDVEQALVDEGYFSHNASTLNLAAI